MSPDILKKYGFRLTGPKKHTSIYAKRIGDIAFIEYDAELSFFSLVSIPQRRKRQSVMIPRKINTEKELLNLINNISYY